MPELPEVETIVRGLSSRIVGQTIDQLEVRLPKMVWLDAVRATGSTEVDRVKALVEGKNIESITRRGKMIIIHLSDDVTLLLHLKMTGQLIYVDASQHRLAGGHPSADMVGELPAKTTHLIFHFSSGGKLYFNDQRQFGYLKVIPATALETHASYVSFGPEPFDPTFTGEYLYQKASHRPSITIKQLILDQSVVAGIGNIYADESLFESKIYPGIIARSLSKENMDVIVANIKLILQRGLNFGGTSSQHFVQSDGEKGSMQDHLMVYRRTGQPCLVCGTPIERTVIGGRGTHYCPNCQPRE